MTTYSKAGSFGWAGGGKSGAIVDLWAANRFAGFPVQNEAPPSGSPDAGPVTTGAIFGNPGGYLITGISTLQDYYVRIQYGGQTFWGAAPASSLGGGSGGVQSVVAGTNITVDDTDPANPIVSAEGAATDMPIANPTGITTGTETPDPISGSDTATWVQFPSNASVMAWGLAGDDFPRVVMGADSTSFGALLMGDGTVDPTTGGAEIFVSNDPNRGMAAFIAGGGAENFGAVLGQTAVTGVNGGHPAGQIGGFLGDFATTNQIGGSYCPGVWRCTTQGDASTAVWSLVSVMAVVDPLSVVGGGGFIPPNAGALWQQTGGSGTLWVSTGTSVGDWAIVGVIANPVGRIYQSTPQSLTTGTKTAITGCTQDYVKGNVTTSVSGTGELIVATTGIYRVTAQVAFDLSGGVAMPTGGLRMNVFLMRNSTEARVGELDMPDSTGNPPLTGVPMVTVSDEISLTASDVLSMKASQNTGGSINTFDSFDSGVGNTTFLSASLVSQ